MYLEFQSPIIYPRVTKCHTVASEELADNLWSKFKSLWSALAYIWDTHLNCMIATDKDSRAKYTTWRSNYNKFFKDLGISPYMDNKKPWKFKTILKASNLIWDVRARWESEEEIMERFRNLIISCKDPELENFLVAIWRKYLKNPTKKNWLKNSKIMSPKWLIIGSKPKQLHK